MAISAKKPKLFARIPKERMPKVLTKNTKIEGKLYYYELTVFSKKSAEFHAKHLRMSGRWGFNVRIVRDHTLEGKVCYHIYSRSKKPGLKD